MPSLKAIRKRISSVKSTQKITRAMKMVAAARLRRAQQRITELRPFAQKTSVVLQHVAMRLGDETSHPLLARRPEKAVMFVIIASDRGLAGAFNANVNRTAERKIRELISEGKRVLLTTIGRKVRDYFRRRNFEIVLELPGVNERIELGRADEIAAQLIDLYIENRSQEIESIDDINTSTTRPSLMDIETRNSLSDLPLDAVYLVYNEFKSAMTQRVVTEQLFPVQFLNEDVSQNSVSQDFLYEPNQSALLDRLLPLYVQVTIFRALLESVASEHGARMTAMDAATNNAKEMIAKLTLEYNRARQASITKELMEIIGGAEAQK